MLGCIAEVEAEARGLAYAVAWGANEAFVAADMAMRSGGGGGGFGLARTFLWPSSDVDFLPELTTGDRFSCAFQSRRGLSVADASEFSTSDSSPSLSPLMLLELRSADVEGGRRLVADPGEKASCENEGTGEFAALRRAWASRNAATDMR